MLVCGKKEVLKNLKKDKLPTIYLKVDYDDKEILDLISEKNREKEQIKIIYLSEKELDKMIDEEHEGIIGEKKDRGFIILTLIISAFLFFFICTGIAFSLYETTNKDHPDTDIPTGSIILNYSDVSGSGNGIRIENAVSVSDIIGMHQTGSGNYFDFSVSGTTSNIPIRYYLLLRKEDTSTLGDDNVKVYLTKMNGTVEEKILDQTYKFSELADKTIQNVSYKTIYSKELGEAIKDFNDGYRLRIWIGEDAKDYYDQTFSLKVDTYAEGIGE